MLFYFVIYFILFVLMVLMGEEMMLFSVYLSSLGFFNFWIMFFVALAGTYTGDLLFFWLGWHFGENLVYKWGKFLFIPRKRFEKIQHLFSNRGRWILFVSKFVYGLGHLTLIAAGTAKMEPKKVIKNQIYSSLIWVVLFSGIGYFFSSFIGAVTRDFKMVGIGIIIVFSIFWGIGRFIDYIIDKTYT